MERGKSQIFPFPFHSNQVKQDLSFFRRIRDGSYFCLCKTAQKSCLCSVTSGFFACDGSFRRFLFSRRFSLRSFLIEGADGRSSGICPPTCSMALRTIRPTS